MPTPDSSSTEAAPVYLIHALGPDRCFWAVWVSQAAFEANHAPRAYGLREQTDRSLRQQLPVELDGAVELPLTPEALVQVYRRIRRSELPEQVRQQIAAALALQRQQLQYDYLEAGFEPEDLEHLARLKRRYRALARAHHPDHGGEPARFRHLQQLYEQARRRLKRRGGQA